MERRKRDQVLKAQKEEQDAHKKRSDLEIELMKRRETLEQAGLLTHTHTQLFFYYIFYFDGVAYSNITYFTI